MVPGYNTNPGFQNSHSSPNDSNDFSSNSHTGNHSQKRKREERIASTFNRTKESMNPSIVLRQIQDRISQDKSTFTQER